MRRLLISAWLNSFSVSVPVLPNCNWKLPSSPTLTTSPLPRLRRITLTNSSRISFTSPEEAVDWAEIRSHNSYTSHVPVVLALA